MNFDVWFLLLQVLYLLFIGDQFDANYGILHEDSLYLVNRTEFWWDSLGGEFLRKPSGFRPSGAAWSCLRPWASAGSVGTSFGLLVRSTVLISLAKLEAHCKRIRKAHPAREERQLMRMFLTNGFVMKRGKFSKVISSPSQLRYSPAALRGFLSLEGFFLSSDWPSPPLVPGPWVSICMLSSLSEVWLFKTFLRLMSWGD